MSTRAPRDPRGAKSAIRKRLAFERKNLDYLTEMHERHRRLIRTKEQEVKRQMDEFIAKERAEMLASAVRATEGHSKAAVARKIDGGLAAARKNRYCQWHTYTNITTKEAVPMRAELMEERRAKQRVVIAPLKEAYQEYRTLHEEFESILRDALNDKLKAQRHGFMNKLQPALDGTSAAAIAEELGVTRQTVYRWLRDIEDTKKVDQ